MEPLFDVLVTEGDQDEVEVRLGVRISVAGETTLCPATRRCFSVEDLEAEADRLHEELERVHEKARKTLAGPGAASAGSIPDDLSVEELWRTLEDLPDDALFVDQFNELEETQRREVAEYVLTACSVFSGRPAFFSARYDSETALLQV